MHIKTTVLCVSIVNGGVSYWDLEKKVDTKQRRKSIVSFVAPLTLEWRHAPTMNQDKAGMMAKVIQEHHIQYAHPDHKSMKDIVVPVFKGEHLILNKIQMFTKKEVSQGFLQALKVFIAQNEYQAIDLDTLRKEIE